jgi:integrase
VGKKEDGTPIRKYIGYFNRRSAALAALAEYNKDPYDVDSSKVTLSAIWAIFKKRKFDNISDSGKNVYNAAYKHLEPIKNTFIKDIKTYHLQTIIDGINSKWQTKSHTQTLLHQLFDIAIELDIVNKNYAEYIKLPTKEKSNMHNMFTTDEIKRLFESVFAHEWADTVLIMIYSGMRPTEMLNIKIEDIHIKEGYIIGGIKTTAGKNRVIPINNKVMPFIKKRFNTDNVFLIERNNRPLTYQIYKKAFDTLMNDLDMKHLPHDGRHTFASMANSAGVNSTAIKLIMGHTSNDLTERVYTHKAVSELITAVNMI